MVIGLVKCMTESIKPPTELILIEQDGSIYKFSVTDAAFQELCYLKNECLQINNTAEDQKISINDIRIVQGERGIIKRIKGYLPHFRKYEVPELQQIPSEATEEKPKPKPRSRSTKTP